MVVGIVWNDQGEKGDAGDHKDESGLPGRHMEGTFPWKGMKGCEAVCPLWVSTDREALGMRWAGAAAEGLKR